MTQGEAKAWAGWIAFAATMLVLVGVINIFQGIVALVWDERVLVTADNFVLVDLTSWGWTVLLSGVLMVAASAGLFAVRNWARIVAIVLVILHAASQIAWLSAFPIWSLLMIGLDTVVLFALTARWTAARDDLAAFSPKADGMPMDSRTQQAHQMRGYDHNVT
jgi:hypothetical protein